MANILVIDDDKLLSEALSDQLTTLGHEVAYELTMDEGFKKASDGLFDVIFLDVRLPDGNGLDILPMIQSVRSSPEVIIMTGSGDPDGAELAIKSGAWDYIEKPSSIDVMVLPLVRALQYREIKMSKKPVIALKREGIIGNSPQMKTCLDYVAQAASTDANVLISGETGTGKELLAWAIHHNSQRSERCFVVVDCAALTETLVESMLFGYQKGAYTGAEKAHDGLIKQADNGTLFLDEVGELPFSIQKSFLRVLQERRFRPLGSKNEVESNFRLVAATNRNLDQMVERGHFRSDLLFRLRSISIEVPPLRTRLGDIPELAMYHLTGLCKRYGIETRGFSPEFLETLLLHDWPGNVRELFNTLDRAVAAAGSDATLFMRHLPTNIRIKIAQAAISKKHESIEDQFDSATGNLPLFQDFRKEAVSNMEQQYLRNLMLSSGRNIKHACQISGLSQSRLYELLKKYEISGSQ
ncbi:MAG TPA: sigma-54 dependent transcriptional regulator [Syntrophales bacterium]|nr:sigma-54 dependent transcriptional regulator [Syntrophales bacterium]